VRKIDTLTIETPAGPAQVQVDEPRGRKRAVLVIGHGAGGGVDAPDILAVRTATLAVGVRVVRVTQPSNSTRRGSPCSKNYAPGGGACR
jgi:predicted alpha/beta-hydrolase family hydrolase